MRHQCNKVAACTHATPRPHSSSPPATYISPPAGRGHDDAWGERIRSTSSAQYSTAEPYICMPWLALKLSGRPIPVLLL